MNCLVSTESECLHYYLGRLFRTQRNAGDFAAMLLLELDSLLEGVFFVRVDYEPRVRGVDRLSVSGYPDASCRVRNPTQTDNSLQQSTAFPSRKSGGTHKVSGGTLEHLVMIMVNS